ncbi:MAG: cupin domain-containing protein [Candidatus Obscuribacterales bacterium]|nr:cupin domain-containing protein [Candidatus Obscuribacterales bacterium]
MKQPFQYSHVDSIPWRKSAFAEGVFIKDLGTSDGQSVQLVKFEPNASFPRHTHSGPEFIYMLDGEAIQQGNRITAGSIAIAGKDTEETEFYSNNGCTFLLIYTV